MGQAEHIGAMDSATSVSKTLRASFATAVATHEPYTYWTARDLLPADIARDICQLPFAAPNLGGVSGKREKHNATRTYFDAANRAAFDVVDATAHAFQSRDVTQVIESTFSTDLTGSFLRIEYAQDVDGFWLQPHSDLGVKLFTLLLYLSDDPAHENLGTDIYDADKSFFARMPFKPNQAMVFVPSDDTFHGFEQRTITGVRRSLIVNYVTDEWLARAQLAFPDTPIAP